MDEVLERLPSRLRFVRQLIEVGPIFPVEPAAFSVWQAPQPLFTKTALPAPAPPPPPAAFPPAFAHLSKSACDITTTVDRITAWPRPQSSVQMIGYVPILFGVTVKFVSIPGTASCFCPNSGTQNEWMTSSARSVKRAGRLIGSLRTFVVRPFCCGYLNVQANCCAVTSTRSGFEPGVVVARQDDRRDDRHRGDERERDRRPRNLEPGVSVNRRAVGVVVGRRRGTSRTSR